MAHLPCLSWPIVIFLQTATVIFYKWIQHSWLFLWNRICPTKFHIIKCFVVCIQSPEVHHPKSLPLMLSNEKVIGISSSLVRASVWTESNKVRSIKSSIVSYVCWDAALKLIFFWCDIYDLVVFFLCCSSISRFFLIILVIHCKANQDCLHKQL